MQDSPQPPPATTRRPEVLLGDLTAGLVWPGLLRAIPLALRPERIVLALAALVLVSLIARMSWADGPALDERYGEILGPLQATGASLSLLTLLGLSLETVIAVARAWIEIQRQDPIEAIVLGLPMLVIWCVFGGAIARSVAVEFALGRVIAWPKALACALASVRSLIGAVLAPTLFIGLLGLLVAVGAWALMGVPVLDVVGAILFGVALLMGLLGALTVVGVLLGGHMLIPAVVCEGTDALDAVQRSFAYVFGRPARLVIYLVVLTAQLLLGLALLTWLASFTVQLTSDAAALFVTGESIVPPPDASGTGAATRRILSFWLALPGAVVSAFLVSFYFTASTLLYLTCRRVNDGQEIAELWTPAGETIEIRS